ncbi:MAG: oligosaccharide flippase family protein [Chloroflexaceae bacterium]|nr:oligosaccharide flippase family protein [Chloroflexaceae bacterium]
MLKSSAIVWVVTIIGIGVGLAQAKISALYLGVEGVGVFGQCLAILTLIQLVVGNAILPAAVRFVALGRAANDLEQIRRVVILMRMLVFAVALLAMGMIIGFAKPLAYIIFSTPAFSHLLILLAVSLPLTTLATTQRTLLQAFERVDLWALDTLIWSFGGLVLLLVLSATYGVAGAVLHLSLQGLLSVVVATWLYRRARGPHAEPLVARVWDAALVRQIMTYNGAAVSVSLAYAGTLLVLRALVIHHAGLAAGGIYHVVVQLSLQYLGIALLSLLAYWSPVIARLQSQSEISAAINSYTRLSLFALLPLLMGVIVLREPFVLLVYSSEFAAVQYLLPAQVLADLLRAAFYPMFISILLQGRLVPYVGIGLCREAVLFVGAWALLAHLNVAGVVLATLLANAGVAVVTYAYVRRAFGFRYTAANLRLLGASGAALVLVLGISCIASLAMSIALAIPIGLAWLWLSSTPAERTYVQDYLSQHLAPVFSQRN